MIHREIKFRVWDEDLKTYTSEYKFIRGQWGKRVLCGKMSTTFSKDIIQQYTGLKDDKDKEVYEGDIVTWSESQSWEEGGGEIIGRYEVKWNEETLRLDFHDPYDGGWWELADTQFDAVIGNIFENPDLLK